ncbi:MAG: hypothetical protein WCK09_11045 [Bacteroidota bacterium]
MRSRKLKGESPPLSVFARILRSAMGGLTIQTILMGNSIFSEFKGALAEQFVLWHLKSRQFIQVFYWSSETITT